MPMYPGRRITVALSAGLLLSAGLGACSSDSPPHATAPPRPLAAPRQDPRPDAGALLSALIQRMDQQGSVHSDVEGKLGLVGDLSGAGTVRYHGPQADVALDGDTQTRDTQARQDVELSIVDGVGYLKSPMLLAEAGKPWVRVAPDGHDLGAEMLGPALDQLKNTTDPRQAFAGVEDATKIQSIAPDRIDGKPVTRYEIRVLTGRAAQITTDPQQRSRMQTAAKHGQPELDYELWVDEAGLPARFTAIRDGQRGQISLTSFYRDWGVPTDIQAPPAELVGKFPDGQAPPMQAPR
jgi:hypothetical protein